MFIEYFFLIYSVMFMMFGFVLVFFVVGLLFFIFFVSLEMNKIVCISKLIMVFFILMCGLFEILVVLLIYFGLIELIEKIIGEYIEFSVFNSGVLVLSVIFVVYVL